jgi:homoserine kinase type II
VSFDDLDLETVLDCFGLRPLDKGRELNGGKDNTNIAVNTEAGVIVVRRYELTPPEFVASELDLVECLAERGYPTPPPLRTVNGERFVNAGKPVALFRLVPGETPEATDAALAAAFGHLLGRLHILARDWDNSRLKEIDRLDLLHQSTQRWLSLAGEAEFREEVHDFLQRHSRYLESILPSLRTGAIHHDLHRLNVIVRSGRVVAVLDFDELNRGPLVADPLRTLHYIAQEDPEWRLPEPLAAATLNGYARRRPFSPLEREALPVLFDMLNLLDAVDFLQNPPDDVTNVAESPSLQIYRANRDYAFAV